MNENEFWIILWKYVLIAMCIITIFSMVSCQFSKYQLRKMTEATGSGIESACAMDMIAEGIGNDAGTALICAQYQLSKK